MRLLITTQAVDRSDPILGFFCRWIEEFAKHCEKVTVICLREGEHDLPDNVRVYALGNFHIARKIIRAVRFYRLLWGLRRDYDAVFVHMNPEYAVLGGWWWWLAGKKAGLWYTHKNVDFKLRVAEKFVDVIFTASKESFRLPTKKLQIMGHGIDTDFFCPDAGVARGTHWLSVGRLDKTKRHDAAIRDAGSAGRALRIAGEGSERENLEALAREIGARVEFLGGISQERLRDEYRRAALLVHRSATGSLDKVVLEAAACGLPVDSSDSAILRLPLSPAYVEAHHSLARLVPRLIAFLS
ncbi:MAG: glycosyltransferase family 4 protein [Minisyncoccia bacterium]